MKKVKSAVKLCLISSRGGHLKQMYKLKDIYKRYENFIITTKDRKTIDSLSDFKRIYYIMDINEGRWKNFFKFIFTLCQVLIIFLKEKPNFLITTGSGLAVPCFLIAKLLGKKTIFIEAGARIKFPSKAGSFCYYFADLFFVQHPYLLKKLPQALYRGALYENIFG